MSITIAALATELGLPPEDIIERVTAYAQTGALAIQPYDSQHLTQRCADSIRNDVCGPAPAALARPEQRDPDSVRILAYATGATTRQILAQVTALIQAHGYDAVILEDDREHPTAAILHRRYADAIRAAHAPADAITRAAIQQAQEGDR